MPDFRARVHPGETFVVAGDRFAMTELGLEWNAERYGV
jgi:hypothetical protein